MGIDQNTLAIIINNGLCFGQEIVNIFAERLLDQPDGIFALDFPHFAIKHDEIEQGGHLVLIIHCFPKLELLLENLLGVHVEFFEEIFSEIIDAKWFNFEVFAGKEETSIAGHNKVVERALSQSIQVPLTQSGDIKIDELFE